MTYVIYNTDNNRQVRLFKTERGAKVSLAAYERKGYSNLKIMKGSDFNAKFNRWTVTKNLLSGREVLIREQDVGTCCDPSTETYWSM